MKVESVLEPMVSDVRRLGVISVATHVTDTPGSVTFFTTRSHLVGLTIDA